MITISIDGKPHDIPTTWDDITFEKYAVIKNPNVENDVIKNVHIYTGIDVKTLFKFTPSQLNTVINLVQFMDEDLTDYVKHEITWESGKGLKVNGIQFDTYGRLEECKQLFKQEANPYIAIAKVIKRYTDLDILPLPVRSVYAYVDFFLHNSIALVSDSKD